MTHLSRREFTALAASAAAAPFLGSDKTSAATLTAGDVVDRIKKNIGVEWKSESVDGLKAGDLSTVVTGIVTTSMATLDVLQQAVKAQANVIVTAQPTFYSRADARTPRPDPVFAAKNDFVDKNTLVIFRLSEHWRARRPEPFAQGMAATLGWTRYQTKSESPAFDVPSTTLESLASAVKKTLRSRGGIRVVGNPRLDVRHVGLLPGTTPILASLQMLPAVDVVVAGEVREWESVEYARDKAFVGEKKGLILLGRVVSEEPGMNVCAAWLKTLVPEVSIRHIPAGDPYWRPSL